MLVDSSVTQTALLFINPLIVCRATTSWLPVYRIENKSNTASCLPAAMHYMQNKNHFLANYCLDAILAVYIFTICSHLNIEAY